MTNTDLLWNKYTLFHRDDEYVVFDPISLESVLLSNNEYLSIRAANISATNKDIFNILARINIIPKKESAPKIEQFENNLLDHKINQIPRRISGLRVLLTNKCNMQCRYCFEDKSFNNELTEDELKLGLHYFFEHNRNQNEVFIQWFGGEPTLKYDLIKKGDEYIENLQKNFCINRVYKTIVSNGLLISDDMIEYFLKNKYSVGISLDGPPKINSVNRVCNTNKSSSKVIEENIKRLRDKGIHIGINLTPTMSNYENLDAIVDYFMSELKINFIYMNFPIFKNGEWNISGENLAEKMYKARKIALAKGGCFQSGLDRIYRALDTRIPQIHDHLESDGSMFVSLISNNKISLSEIYFTSDEIQCGIKEISNLKLISEKISKNYPPLKKCMDCDLINICCGPSKVDNIYRKSMEPDIEFCKFCKRALELAIEDMS